MESEARSFWNDQFFDTFCRIAYRFGIEPEAPYPFYEIRRDHVLSWLDGHEPGRVLDVGCGGGHVMEALLDRGWNAAGCDFAPRMVAFARQRLADAGWTEATVEDHAATDLSAYSSGSFDTVLCLGPIEYLGDEEVERAYREMARVLAPGGVLICAHINALFDLFTLDDFTAEFLERVLAEAFGTTLQSRDDVSAELRKQLGREAGPRETRSGSIRNRVPTRSDNPLTVGDVLRRCGFALEDQRFYRFYTAPPVVARALDLKETDAIPYERELAGGWLGHVLASSFLTYSVRR